MTFPYPHSRPVVEHCASFSERQNSPPIVRTAALIPAHNEYRFIGSVVLAARAHVDLVVVVDDGSSDSTAEIAERAGAVVLRHQTNQGKAAAINTGFGYLRDRHPQAVVLLDGDGQHCAEDIPAVLAPVLAGHADLVVGSRFLSIASAIPTYRQVGQHSLTMMTNLASGVRVSDSQSGFRALSAHALDVLCFSCAGFSLESEMQFLARENGLRVVEAPINVIYAEKAKRNPVAHGMQVLNGIIQMVGQTRPLLFFGAAGLLTLLLGTALGLYIVDIYARTLQLAVGYAFVTVILCVIGALLFFAGIILHSTRSMISELRRALFTRLVSASAAPPTPLPHPDRRALLPVSRPPRADRAVGNLHQQRGAR